MVTRDICTCIFTTIGDPGYPGPPGQTGLAGEKGHKGNHNTTVISLLLLYFR